MTYYISFNIQHRFLSGELYFWYVYGFQCQVSFAQMLKMHVRKQTTLCVYYSVWTHVLTHTVQTVSSVLNSVFRDTNKKSVHTLCI